MGTSCRLPLDRLVLRPRDDAPRGQQLRPFSALNTHRKPLRLESTVPKQGDSSPSVLHVSCTTVESEPGSKYRHANGARSGCRLKGFSVRSSDSSAAAVWAPVTRKQTLGTTEQRFRGCPQNPEAQLGARVPGEFFVPVFPCGSGGVCPVFISFGCIQPADLLGAIHCLSPSLVDIQERAAEEGMNSVILPTASSL
jgi:hypothetical protein